MGLTLTGNMRLPIELLPGIKLVDVASGVDHLVMLTSNGQIYTMGCGEQGQLGRVSLRTASGESRRGKVDLLQPALVNVHKLKPDAIWATAYCTFFRDHNTSAIYGFGLNNYNQLGLEKCGGEIIVPKKTTFDDVKIIAGGQHHTLVLKNNGKCYVIGRKEYGRLGLGDIKDDVEVLTLIKQLDNIKHISCGDCSSFAITNDGKVYAWGMGSNQQLGTGSEDDVETPILLTALQLKDKKLLNVSGGGQHTLFVVEEIPVDDAKTTEVVKPVNGDVVKSSTKKGGKDSVNNDIVAVEEIAVIQSKDITTTSAKQRTKKK